MSGGANVLEPGCSETTRPGKNSESSVGMTSLEQEVLPLRRGQ